MPRLGAIRSSPANTETNHTTKRIAYLTIEGDGTLTTAITTITRSTYTAAGQPIAVRVSGHPSSNNNGLFRIHADHLGSVAVLTKYSDGYVRGSSRAYYYPFGAYRWQPSSDLTGRRFTGQRENMEWGLYYYNARYYVPGLGRFASADTIVPDPTAPQSFNRYSYALNNPLKYTDPFGRCATDPYDEYADYYCWQLAYQLQDSLGLGIDFLSLLDVTQLQFLQGAIAELEDVTVPMLGLGIDIADPVLQNLSDASSEPSFVHHLESGGWDVIGVRFDLGYGGIHGIDASFDLLFNFDALELSGAGNLNYTAGFMLGGNISTGVFIGFNAPTNDVFAGWGSGMTLSAAYEAIGFTIQWDVADRLFLLGNARPEQHGVRSDDPMNLAVMYSIGAEIEFSATLVGYSWVRTLYRW